MEERSDKGEDPEWERNKLYRRRLVGELFV